MARAYDLPADPGMTEEFDFREYGRAGRRSARSRSSRCRSPTRCRRSGCGSTADGRTLAYTGDTGPCPALDDVAADADLLLAEASFRHGDDNPADLHLTGAEARRRSPRGAASTRLVLTHVPPWYDVAGHARRGGARRTTASSSLAAPGATYDV